MNLLLGSFIGVLLALLSQGPLQVTSDCCHVAEGSWVFGGVCYDCAWSNKGCCGSLSDANGMPIISSCNFFCCGCEGGCRQGIQPFVYPRCTGYPSYTAGYPGWGSYYRRRALTTRQDGSRSVEDFLSEIDTDGDGKVSESEMDAYIAEKHRGNGTVADVDVKSLYDFSKFDKDGDHYLSAAEIDSK